MPETEARRRLNGRVAAFSVLAPVGSFAGKGALRVLRASAVADAVELVCGYEAYERAN
jgi:hypothetical protein